MEKKLSRLAGILIISAIALIIFYLFSSVMTKGKNQNIVITDSRLEKAIDISELSTAEFVYNGISEKYSDKDPDKIQCYISYNANVKVGIQMEDIEFEIDKANKTVSPILPDFTITVAELDEESISYIPANPDISLKEVIALCKEDAMKEAKNSEKLYETARENLKAVIEALLSPLLENAGYTIVWEA